VLPSVTVAMPLRSAKWAPQRVLGLVADEEDDVALVPDAVFEVVEDARAGRLHRDCRPWPDNVAF